MYGHPLTYQATAGGLEVGYPTTPAIVGEGRQYEYAHKRDLTLGLTGLNSPDTKADDWSDWTVTPYWSDGTRTLRTTIGHGLPFVYAKGSGGDARITTAAAPTVFADQGNVLGITVAGHHYALFAPDRQRLDRLRLHRHRRPRRQGLLLARRTALHRRAGDVQEVRLQLRHRLQGDLELHRRHRPGHLHPDHRGQGGHRARHAPGPLPPPVAAHHRRAHRRTPTSHRAAP